MDKLTKYKQQLSQIVTVIINIYSIAQIIKYIYQFNKVYECEKSDLKYCTIGKFIGKVKIKIIHRVSYQALLYQLNNSIDNQRHYLLSTNHITKKKLMIWGLSHVKVNN